MGTVIKLVQGDDLPAVSFTIRDAHSAAYGMVLDKKDPDTWAPVDLTGATVTGVVSKAGENRQIDVVAVYVTAPSVGCVIVHLSDCSFISTVGEYECEVTVLFPLGQQTVYDMLTFDVRERINASSPI